MGKSPWDDHRVLKAMANSNRDPLLSANAQAQLEAKRQADIDKTRFEIRSFLAKLGPPKSFHIRRNRYFGGRDTYRGWTIAKSRSDLWRFDRRERHIEIITTDFKVAHLVQTDGEAFFRQAYVIDPSQPQRYHLERLLSYYPHK